MSTGFKLMRIKNGKLYPLYVLYNKEIPIGKWLQAEAGPVNERGKVKGKMELAYRPGWHIAGSKPEAPQITEKRDEMVWVECEYANKIDYNPIARQNGTNKKGKIVSIKACLREIPYDGFYYFKTSFKQKEPWIITGAIKITRIMTWEEVDELRKKKHTA